MSKVITPILLILIAIGLFFTYLRPGYDVLQAFQAQSDRLDDSIAKSKDLLEKHNRLLAEYESLGSDNIATLNKILPDSLDTVRMVLDLDALTARHGLSVRMFGMPDPNKPLARSNRNVAQAQQDENDPVGRAVVVIEFTGEYEDFKAFLRDVETSMSLMDVVSLDIIVTDVTQPGTDREVVYKVGLQTYWLK
jgi:Tfp pilus assembly protein PilO